MWRRGLRPPPTTSGFRPSGWSRFSLEPLEVGQPDLDERRDLLLDPCGSCERQGPLPAFTCPVSARPLLQAVIAFDERPLDTAANVSLHVATLREPLVPGMLGMAD
jgi:hypothetical protein